MAWFKPLGGMRRLRQQIHQSEAVPQLTLLGIMVGLATGLLMITFRLIIEVPLAFWFEGDPENFESLSIPWRFGLPLFGCLLLALLWYYLPAPYKRVGVAHVLERLNGASGRMPITNVFVQFVTGVVAIITGQSVGREGPAIHMGAGVSSYIGQSLNLPNHSIQTLVGCGAAAAIAASFNTPIAGVIFSMEVILMEYTLAGFVPIIAAAATATLVMRLVFGSATAFAVPSADLASLAEVPYLVLCGVIIGCFAALFNRFIRSFFQYQHLSVWIRFTLVGLVTGTIAIIAPEIMSTGYDTIGDAVEGNLTLQVLIIVFCAKMIATAVAIGLGLPAGLIGPTFVLGAALGGILGFLGNDYIFDNGSDPAFYALIGMGAMMSSVLQAPLAALMAMMELTSNSHIIFPAMLTLVTANLTSQHIFKQPSIFSSLLSAQGLSTTSTPVAQAMRRMSALRMAVTQFPVVESQISFDSLHTMLDQYKTILVKHKEDSSSFLLESAYVKHQLGERLSTQEEGEEQLIDLTQWCTPSHRLIWLPTHVTVEEVVRTIQGKEVAGVILSIGLNTPPEGFISKQQLLSYFTSLGE